MSVEWVRFGDVLELQRRLVEPELEQSYREIGVRSFGRGIFIKEPRLGSEIGDKRVFSIEIGDLVVSNVFAWEGAVGVARAEAEETIGSHRFMTWTARDGRAHVPYVAQFLVSEVGLELLRGASPGSAGRNRTLSIRNLEGIEIPLPPIAEQRRIAVHLDAVQDSVVHLASKSVAFPLRRLPTVVGDVISKADLPITTVGALLSVVNTTIHPGEPLQGATEFVGLEHIASHTGDRLGSRAIHEETGRKFLFRPGQVTFGYLRPYLNKAWVADRTGLCSVEQFVLEPVDGLAPELLGHLLRSAHVLDRAIAATNRLQLPRLSLKTLLAMEAPDIRVAQPDLTRRLDVLRDQFVTLSRIDKRREVLREGMLPAARNEIFSAMR